MDIIKEVKQCQVLNVGVVARGSRCLSIMRALKSIKPIHFQLKIAGIAAVSKSIACYKYAGEMDIELFDNYIELLSLDHLDFILELTGEQQILSDLVNHKQPTVGILDRQASTLLLDIATLYERVADKATEINLATSFASALLEASPDGVMVIDRHFRIIDCNDSPLITGNKGRAFVLGKSCFEVIHDSLKHCECIGRICPAQETLSTHRPSRVLHETSSFNGESQVSQVTAYPIFNQLNEIVQIVITVRDITKTLADRIEQRTQVIKDDLARFAQEDRLASLGRLVASVCHEINNPITSIVTFNKLILSYIRESKMPPEGLTGFERYLDLSIREALRCGSIVNNLLTFARQKSVEAKDIDLIEVVKTILMLTKHQLESGQVEYEVNLPKAPFKVCGDSAQIQQCLMNLIFNAIESMPEGGKLTISGGLDDGEDMVWLSVADNGQGIKREDLPHIFEPFYSTKLDGKGVGLGLSMTYGIIREHNGVIEVDSKPDKGTVFKIKLPKISTDERDNADARSMSSAI
ncbi:MAG: PAS domain-containing protein [Deltaproteobacteria bacterium]|nr:PAS domain-containing protein [Deltaproteobacteria bacterium]MBW2639632.1 PAS domain-containing protein [Deltaproteobacteria bacterium]